MNTLKERRASKRFPVKGGAIVYFQKRAFFLSNASEYIQIGPVSDISSNGISLFYFMNNKSITNCSKLAIITPSGKIIIDDIKFKSVYDIDVGRLPGGKKIRKTALKFEDISGYQSAWIACMIHNLKSRQDELSQPTNHADQPVILQEVY